MVKVTSKAGRATPVPVAQPPVQHLFGLRQEIDHLFDDFFRSFRFPRFGRGTFDIEPFRRFESSFGVSVPHVDVTESEDEFEITAELPGMDEQDIDITLSEGVLTLKGEKKEETEKRDKKRDYYVMERSYGTFQRSLTLPVDINEAKTKATFKNGVLTVTLPKKVAAKKEERKVPISS